jgi:hypothetical protein
MRTLLASLFAVGALAFLGNSAQAAPVTHQMDLDQLVRATAEIQQTSYAHEQQLARHCAPRHHHGHHHHQGYPRRGTYYRGGYGGGGYGGYGGYGYGGGGLGYGGFSPYYGRGMYGPYGRSGLGLFIGF